LIDSGILVKKLVCSFSALYQGSELIMTDLCFGRLASCLLDLTRPPHIIISETPRTLSISR